MNKFKKVLNVIVNIILVIYLIFAVVVCAIAVSSSRNDGIPSLFGYSLFNIKTNSMETNSKDSLNVGDLIITKKLDNIEVLNLKENDIITYYFSLELEDGTKVREIRTHRIVSVDNNDPDYSLAFYTKGDNASSVDEKVPATDVIAKYTGYKVCGGGKVIDFLKSRNGLFFCLIIPLAAFFIYALVKFIRAIVLAKAQKQTAAELSEEEKARIAREYLASHGKSPENAPEEASAPEETAEEVSEPENKE